MKRVLFSMVLLMAVSFAFAQEKNVKEAKSIAGEVKPDFAKAEQLINEALTNPCLLYTSKSSFKYIQ